MARRNAEAASSPLHPPRSFGPRPAPPLRLSRSARSPAAARLEAAASGAQTAVYANGDAFNAWDKERSEEVVAKGRLRIEIERTHRALGAHFAGQRDFVESFFLKGEKPSEGAQDDAAPTEPSQAPIEPKPA